MNSGTAQVGKATGFFGILLISIFTYGSAPAGGPSRIIFITIDTLRADRLDCYGYANIKTPHVSRLARDGVLFRDAVAPIPLTLPSHCSIFTGTFPIHHGVRDHAGFALSPEADTLAARLKARGFATGAFVGSFVLDSRFGLNKGFDFYYDRFDSTRVKSGSPESLERRADAVAQEALRWMQSQSGAFLAWLHFYDPHVPYDPPEPFRSRYPKSAYDGEVAYTDFVVGKVLDFLDRKGWYENSLVVLTSDHGEDLGDHGENTHGLFLYDAVVRVPLLIKFPHGRHAGKQIGGQVRSVDIMPTVLQSLNLPLGGQIQGRGLLSLVTGSASASIPDAYGETFYPYYHFGWSPLMSVRTGRHKYIDGPRPELYDLTADPGEKKNIFAGNRAIADQMRDRLRTGYGRLAGRSRAAKEQPNDPSTLERLRSLGYLSYSSRTTLAGVDHALPDPKDRLHVYNLVQNGVRDGQSGRTQSAIQKLQQALQLDPGIIDARIDLGLLHKRNGNFAGAVEEFRLALKSDDRNVVAAYNLANAYAAWGKLPEAIVGFKRTLELDPREVRAYVGLGIAYQLQGKQNEAMREYQAALAVDPSDSTALNNMGAVHLAHGDAANAVASLTRSLEINEANPETHNLLGSAYWLSDQGETAVASFRRAVALDRRYLDPYLNLGMLLGKLNRTAEALKYLKAALELAPRDPRVYEILGQTHLAAGRKAEADAAFGRARELAGSK